MRALLLLLALGAHAAHAEEVPAEAAPGDAPSPAAPPADVLVVTSEVEGRGNDATARVAEALLVARGEALLACRVAPPDGEAPLRFFQARVQVRPADGRVKRIEVTSSTGVEAVDTCVVDLVRELTWAPPPTFADRLQVNVTWRAPTPP